MNATNNATTTKKTAERARTDALYRRTLEEDLYKMKRIVRNYQDAISEAERRIAYIEARMRELDDRLSSAGNN